MVSTTFVDVTLNWCYQDAMAKQDDYVRITLRLPPYLHQMLLESTSAESLNAAIVTRLLTSFGLKEHLAEHKKVVEREMADRLGLIRVAQPDGSVQYHL